MNVQLTINIFRTIISSPIPQLSTVDEPVRVRHLRKILQIQNQFEQAHQVRVQQRAAISVPHMQEEVLPEDPLEEALDVFGA